ncbi:hypothetical protein [Amantichitinum ursilacus]|uniref:Glycine zipper domain-containing protein n=1 Tax=Amantichitinum ursilacus TaxID=857265 RepID=A0A0N1JRM8_9NEIS|nr:hypothetical protein [Amantichitinum ursilacus]KPC49579.1 hypothetical protein WG78_19685 [Amantichitinum ursilacus]
MSNTRVELEQRPGHDPITGEDEFHPAGTAGGAVVGGVAGVGVAAAAGASLGAVAGPIGMAAGAAIGAVAGGLIGKAVTEKFDPAAEDTYWREAHAGQPYANPDQPFEYYQSAYRAGYEGAVRYPGENFEDVETHIRRDYESHRGATDLDWPDSRDAARASWDRASSRLVPR